MELPVTTRCKVQFPTLSEVHSSDHIRLNEVAPQALLIVIGATNVTRILSGCFWFGPADRDAGASNYNAADKLEADTIQPRKSESLEGRQNIAPAAALVFVDLFVVVHRR